MKWKLHVLTEPFTGLLQNVYYMSKLSKWGSRVKVKGYNDWYQKKGDYNLRYTLYEKLGEQENLADVAMDYLEFGVSGGTSFRWWLQYNKNPGSRFFGFDTFEGLPEKFGPFAKGAMAVAEEAVNVSGSRHSFHKGLFQETLIPFLENYRGTNRKLIHMDADLFSSTLFTLSQLFRFLKEGDIIMFDEFAVPKHEFKAFMMFVESFYLEYEVLCAANNYMFIAFKIKANKKMITG
jgi:O-methyltransferase